MAKITKVVDGQKLIGGLEAEDIPEIDASKVTSGSFDASTRVTDGTITVGKLDSSLLKYLLGVARVDYGHVGYCKVG